MSSQIYASPTSSTRPPSIWGLRARQRGGRGLLVLVEAERDHAVDALRKRRGVGSLSEKPECGLEEQVREVVGHLVLELLDDGFDIDESRRACAFMIRSCRW